MFYFGREELRILLEASLSGREIKIFQSLSLYEGRTFSSVVRLLPDYPESTAKNIIRKLKSLNLIECGDRDNTNIPLVLTDFGLAILEVLDSRGYDNFYCINASPRESNAK